MHLFRPYGQNEIGLVLCGILEVLLNITLLSFLYPYCKVSRNACMVASTMIGNAACP